MANYKYNRIGNRSFGIFSYYNHQVSVRLVNYQRTVFNYFGFEVNQVENNKYSEHGDFLNDIIRNVTDPDYIIFFDIDCIPVSKDWFNKLWIDLQKRDTIVGAAQTANHLQEGKNLYVSPFFCAISTDYLKKLKYPDLRITETMDGGQNLTEVIRRANGNICFWWPTDIEEELWDLYHPEHTRFGMGTTYNNAVYHAFFSRMDKSERFIKKCKEILPWYYRLKSYGKKRKS